ncbi:hypothetical protein BBC27_08000 [Acidithiobacillus ferrivorans]|uniref:Uncharacterized protein n=1 Tax=Acidithiobacillus ferrivorans TaxID=160808 RepID=A0A1B9C0A6_9PROT|nr:hypothetical protein [Acidithiobacillus ferrivorans]OCB03399.1 hypothetical protein BBC27_08000 [Acidithiobacillus ferrivorans]
MNLKGLLGRNDEQLLTAKDYRISTALRIRSGQALTVLTPIAAIGAITNVPALMIPALYVVVAQGHSYQLLKAPLVKLCGSKHFWRTLGVLAGSYTAWELFPVFYSWFGPAPAYTVYVNHAHRVIIERYTHWLWIVGGVLSVGMGGLSYLWMKGGQTKSMQRIAQHLANQEAENA